MVISGRSSDGSSDERDLGAFLSGSTVLTRTTSSGMKPEAVSFGSMVSTEASSGDGPRLIGSSSAGSAAAAGPGVSPAGLSSAESDSAARGSVISGREGRVSLCVFSLASAAFSICSKGSSADGVSSAVCSSAFSKASTAGVLSCAGAAASCAASAVWGAGAAKSGISGVCCRVSGFGLAGDVCSAGASAAACWTKPISFLDSRLVMAFKSSKSIMQVWSLIFCSNTLKDSSRLSFPSARDVIFCSRWVWEFLTSFWFSKSRNISYLVSAEKMSSSGIWSSMVPSMSLISISLSLMVISPECSLSVTVGADTVCF